MNISYSNFIWQRSMCGRTTQRQKWEVEGETEKRQNVRSVFSILLCAAHAVMMRSRGKGRTSIMSGSEDVYECCAMCVSVRRTCVLDCSESSPSEINSPQLFSSVFCMGCDTEQIKNPLSIKEVVLLPLTWSWDICFCRAVCMKLKTKKKEKKM